MSLTVTFTFYNLLTFKLFFFNVFSLWCTLLWLVTPVDSCRSIELLRLSWNLESFDIDSVKFYLDKCYFLYIRHWNLTYLSLFVTCCPPLFLIFVYYVQYLTFSEWKVILILRLYGNGQELCLCYKDVMRLTLPSKSNFPITTSNFRWTGRRSGVVSR